MCDVARTEECVPWQRTHCHRDVTVVARTSPLCLLSVSCLSPVCLLSGSSLWGPPHLRTDYGTALWRDGAMAQAFECDPARSFGHGWRALAYFLVLIIFGAFVMPTVLVGVISMSFEQSTMQV